MIRYIVLSVLLFPSLAFSTSPNCVLHESVCFRRCCPAGADKTNDVVNNTIYVVSSNRGTKFADWVAYVVKRQNLDGPNKETRNWKKDPSIADEYTMRPMDYKYVSIHNYDRGHLAPLADFSNSSEWKKSNYLSNVAPQQATLNRGLWLGLEKAERKLVKKQGYKLVHIITGTWYDESRMPALPHSTLDHKVPNGFWKVLVVENQEKKIGVVAFKMHQYEKTEAFCDTRTSLESINNLAGLSVLPGIENSNIDPSASEQLLVDLNCKQALIVSLISQNKLPQSLG